MKNSHWKIEQVYTRRVAAPAVRGGALMTRHAGRKVLPRCLGVPALDQFVLEEHIRQDERQKMVRVLHDDLGQLLAALQLGLDDLEQQGRADGDAGELAFLSSLVAEAITTARQVSASIRPVAVSGRTVRAVVREVLDVFVRTTRGKLVCRLVCAPEIEELPLQDAQRVLLYRAVQLLVTNAIRHGKARVVDVRLAPQGSVLCMEIRDDGVGFDARQWSCQLGIGLRDLQSMLALQGGWLRVHSAPGEGTAVSVLLPLS